MAYKNMDPVFGFLCLNLCSTTSCYSDVEQVALLIPSFLISQMEIMSILICNVGEKFMFVECAALGLTAYIK